MSRFHSGALLAGLIFAAAGVAFLLDAMAILPLQPELLVPVVVIALGISLVIDGALRRGRRKES